MRTTLFLSVLFAGLFCACNGGGHDDNKNHSGNHDNDTLIVQDSCYSDFYLLSDAAGYFTSGYQVLIGQTQQLQGVQNLSDSVTSLTFSNQSLQDLQSQCSDCDGVRMYFGIEAVSDSGSTEIFHEPKLILVNMQSGSCNDQEGTAVPILISGTDTVSTNSCHIAKSYILEWQAWHSSLSGSFPAFTPVQAYNFKWANLDTLIGTNDLIVSFGVHSVSPMDTRFENSSVTLEDCQDLNAAGRMVVNLICQSSSMNQNEAACSRIDFANPCPYYCGDDGKQFYKHCR